MTTLEIDLMPSDKIRTISKKVGNFGSSMLFKVMKEKDLIVVITREGLLTYHGNAQYAFYSGVKNKHFRTFKNSKLASNYILKNL